jgi:hypothetical protein
MKKSILCAMFLLSSIVAHADCSKVKTDNIKLAQMIAADDEIGGKIFDQDGADLSKAELTGEAKKMYSSLSRNVSVDIRVSFKVFYKAKGVNLIVLGTNNDGNGFYSVYNVRGDFLNSISFTESDASPWECVKK